MAPLQGRPSHGTACFACVAAAHSQHHPPRICTQAAPQPASQTPQALHSGNLAFSKLGIFRRQEQVGWLVSKWLIFP